MWTAGPLLGDAEAQVVHVRAAIFAELNPPAAFSVSSGEESGTRPMSNRVAQTSRVPIEQVNVAGR
jgi:hypothetical protein